MLHTQDFHITHCTLHAKKNSLNCVILGQNRLGMKTDERKKVLFLLDLLKPKTYTVHICPVITL